MKLITSQKYLLTASFVLFALPGFVLRSEACTAFQFRAGDNHYLAKSHDFMMGEGLLVVNRRGIAKRSALTPNTSFEWVSRYGSVTYNQFGREMPNGGMNEAGLVVEMLWLNETKYAPVDDRKEIELLQWVQYQLDTAKTVGDVIASDRSLRIVAGPASVHFFVADREGGLAVLELLDGKLRVHRGADLPVPVLANDVYAKCVEALKVGSMPGTAPLSSFDRFQTLAGQTDKFEPKHGEPQRFAFAALQRVRHPQYTQWQIVYDPVGSRVSLRRQVDDTVREVGFAACDFSPVPAPMAADLTKPGALAWTICTPELNRAVIAKSYAATPFLREVSAADLELIATFPESFRPAATTDLRKLN
jgi:hypothetical protein